MRLNIKYLYFTSVTICFIPSNYSEMILSYKPHLNLHS